MEATNQINLNDIIIKERLKEAKCSKCEQDFNDEDIKYKNYSLFFEVDERSEWVKHDEGYKLGVILTKFTHGWTPKYPSIYDCPYIKTCHDCLDKHREKETQKGLNEDDKENYYCDYCFDEKYGELLRERAKHKELTTEQKEIMEAVQKAINEHLASNYHNIAGNGNYGLCKGSNCEGYKQVLVSYGYERV